MGLSKVWPVVNVILLMCELPYPLPLAREARLSSCTSRWRRGSTRSGLRRTCRASTFAGTRPTRSSRRRRPTSGCRCWRAFGRRTAPPCRTSAASAAARFASGPGARLSAPCCPCWRPAAGRSVRWGPERFRDFHCWRFRWLRGRWCRSTSPASKTLRPASLSTSRSWKSKSNDWFNSVHNFYSSTWMYSAFPDVIFLPCFTVHRYKLNYQCLWSLRHAYQLVPFI